jgi:outer membrane receptor for ferrienterochelin and colicins
VKQFCTDFLFVLCLFPCIAFGQQSSSQSGEIYGTVYQQTLKLPIESAQVRIVETNQRVLTNANGEFQFRSLPPGKYTLTANASGYPPSTDVVVTVTSAEAARVEIYLEPVVVSLDEVEVTAESSRPSVRKSLSGLMSTPAVTAPNLASILKRLSTSIPGTKTRAVSVQNSTLTCSTPKGY